MYTALIVKQIHRMSAHVTFHRKASSSSYFVHALWWLIPTNLLTRFSSEIARISSWRNFFLSLLPFCTLSMEVTPDLMFCKLFCLGYKPLFIVLLNRGFCFMRLKTLLTDLVTFFLLLLKINIKTSKIFKML